MLHVLDSLVDQLHTVGASMGGMSALAFALKHASRCRRLVSISLLLRIASRDCPVITAAQIIRKDPLWQHGQYDANHGLVTGMRLARKLGMISYRSGEEWPNVLAANGHRILPNRTHPLASTLKWNPT